MENRYLYFTHEDDLSKILKSKIITRTKSKDNNSMGYGFLDSKGRTIVAFVYNVSMILNSRCYIAYPLDALGRRYSVVWKWLFKFFPFPVRVPCYHVPDRLRAITFTVSNEQDIEHWYLYDDSLVERKYCESVSAKALKIEDIEEIDLTRALDILGLKKPYISYVPNYFLCNGILISTSYKIGW